MLTLEASSLYSWKNSFRTSLSMHQSIALLTASAIIVLRLASGRQKNSSSSLPCFILKLMSRAKRVTNGSNWWSLRHQFGFESGTLSNLFLLCIFALWRQKWNTTLRFCRFSVKKAGWTKEYEVSFLAATCLCLGIVTRHLRRGRLIVFFQNDRYDNYKKI